MNKCKQCGGVLSFNPIKQNLICHNCQSEYSFKISDDVKFNEFSMDLSVEESDLGLNAMKMHCPSCGAVFSDKVASISTTCDYCGSHLVADFVDSRVAPDACIPFAFDVKNAEKKFKDALQNKRFIPNKIRNESLSGKIESIYIPAYLYEISTQSKYNGRLYENDTDSQGNTERDYFKVSGSKDYSTRDIIVECSSQMNQLTLDSIKPFNLSEMKKYSPEFLLGYSVEYYDKKLEETKPFVRRIVEDRIRNAILRDYSHDGVDYLNIDTTYLESKYLKLVLPTYRVNFKNGNKNYSAFLNGQTGKVGGRFPRSAWKIGFLVVGILCGIGVIAGIIINALT